MTSTANNNRYLFASLNNAVLYDDASPYHQMLKKLYDIDVEYFEKIPAWTERIPSKLDFQLKDNIVADFNKLADQLLNQELKNRLIDELRSDGVKVSVDDVKNSFESLKRIAPLYFNKTKPCPEVGERELQKLYRKAKYRSLLERIFRSNGSDVFDFHQSLMYRTVWECKELIEKRTLCFIGEVMKNCADS